MVITKVDKDNKNALAGAEFIIKNENGEEVARGKTDETGVVKFTELPYGKYTYQEVIAPKGYVLDSKEYSFAITIDNEEVNIAVENEKIEKEPKPSNNKGNTIDELPKTGDASIMGFVGALLLSVGGLLINDRK